MCPLGNGCGFHAGHDAYPISDHACLGSVGAGWTRSTDACVCMETV